MENKRPEWTSTLGFILAAIGSAVGLGNIWRFPYLMGQNGGAVFLVVYLLIICTICFIPLCVELFIGKTTKCDNVTSFEKINPNFKIFGWSNVLTGILISSFYFIVGAWILFYIFQNLLNISVLDFGENFSVLSANGTTCYFLTLLFLFSVCFFVARGVKAGIEAANKVMMPMLTLILILLVIFSLNLPNAQLGLDFMFKPDFSKLTPQMFLAALGQAFFTLSIGMGAIMIYGSYMKEKDDIKKSAYTIIFSDTLFALLTGVMIFPAVFSFGLQPDSGCGLVFVTLPKIFAQLPFGNIVAILFFALLLFAALTSGISMVEVPTATLIERYKFSRIKAAVVVGLLISLLALPAALSFGVLANLKIFNMTIFNFFDFLTSNILLPANTLFACIICGWVYKIKKGDILKSTIGFKIFNFTLKFILPVVFVFLLLFGIFG